MLNPQNNPQKEKNSFEAKEQICGGLNRLNALRSQINNGYDVALSTEAIYLSDRLIKEAPLVIEKGDSLLVDIFIASSYLYYELNKLENSIDCMRHVYELADNDIVKLECLDHIAICCHYLGERERHCLVFEEIVTLAEQSTSFELPLVLLLRLNLSIARHWALSGKIGSQEIESDLNNIIDNFETEKIPPETLRGVLSSASRSCEKNGSNAGIEVLLRRILYTEDISVEDNLSYKRMYAYILKENNKFYQAINTANEALSELKALETQKFDNTQDFIANLDGCLESEKSIRFTMIRSFEGLGKLDEAMSTYKKLIAKLARRRGADHLDVVNLKIDLIHLAIDYGMLQDAKILVNDVTKTLTHKLDSSLSWVLAEFRSEEFSESLAKYDSALDEEQSSLLFTYLNALAIETNFILLDADIKTEWYDSGVAKFDKAISLSRLFPRDEVIDILIGVFAGKSLIEYKLGNGEKALSTINQAYDYVDFENDLDQVNCAILLQAKGELLMMLGQSENAEPCLIMAYDMFCRIDGYENSNKILNLLSALGRLYLEKEEYRKARGYFEKALALNQANDAAPQLNIEICSSLINIASLSGEDDYVGELKLIVEKSNSQLLWLNSQ